MKSKLILVGAFLVLSVSVKAQSLATLSGTASDVAQVVQSAQFPPGVWAGKLDLKSLPIPAVYQSFTSANQAFGFHKNIWSLYKGKYEVLRTGVFGGFYKPLLSEPSSSPHPLGGGTVLVPGSAFDWALGTSYGDRWLPDLKTGILVAWDFTHPKTLKLAPDFAGPGLTYKFW